MLQEIPFRARDLFWSKASILLILSESNSPGLSIFDTSFPFDMSRFVAFQFHPFVRFHTVVNLFIESFFSKNNKKRFLLLGVNNNYVR